jgi:hypothetical protein
MTMRQAWHVESAGKDEEWGFVTFFGRYVVLTGKWLSNFRRLVRPSP